MPPDTIYPSNRLIYLSLAYSSGRKRIVAQNSTELTELIQRYQADDSFRSAVDEALRAMELRLLTLDDNGLRLSARNADSFFAATLTDYGRMLARGDLKAADVLPVHCAIATALFPTEAELDMPVEDLGAIMMEDVIDILRRFAQIEPKLPAEEDRLHPQVRTVARRLRELPEANPDRLRAGAGNSWVDLVSQILEHLVETGYLLKFEETPEDVEYRPTPGYQISLREGIVYSFHAFRDILADHERAAPTAKPGDEGDVSTL